MVRHPESLSLVATFFDDAVRPYPLGLGGIPPAFKLWTRHPFKVRHVSRGQHLLVGKSHDRYQKVKAPIVFDLSSAESCPQRRADSGSAFRSTKAFRKSLVFATLGSLSRER